MAEQTSQTPNENNLAANLEKMKAHFDCLSQIEALHNGSLTDAPSLREALKQNSFLLGLEANKSKFFVQEYSIQKRQVERARKEKLDMQNAKQS